MIVLTKGKASAPNSVAASTGWLKAADRTNGTSPRAPRTFRLPMNVPLYTIPFIMPRTGCSATEAREGSRPWIASMAIPVMR